MMRLKKNLLGFIVIGLLTIVWGGFEPSAIAMGATASNTGSKTSTPPPASDEADSYTRKVVPLTTLECARCHETVFNTIRDNGGLHRQECRECHETFHTYRPGSSWKQAVPQCETCHGEIHGPDFKKCLDCHGNPHAPIAGLVNMTTLAENCAKCHTEQAAEVQQYPSAHSEESCDSCHHSRHGYIPKCVECHDEPHVAFVENSGCTGCHPVHKPTEIHFSKDTPTAACAGCHEETAKMLLGTTKKHASLQCAYCHSDTHGYIPDCQKCHGLPHSKAMLDRFDGCLACHGDPHALIFPGE
jgi:predicted CXXCH cytochrome family protein